MGAHRSIGLSDVQPVKIGLWTSALATVALLALTAAWWQTQQAPHPEALKAAASAVLDNLRAQSPDVLLEPGTVAERGRYTQLISPAMALPRWFDLAPDDARAIVAVATTGQCPGPMSNPAAQKAMDWAAFGAGHDPGPAPAFFALPPLMHPSGRS
ncbi:MAG: hypothetical protein ACI9WU_002387 [Myxococcota bacterium]